MIPKTSFIDNQQVATQFSRGDTVLFPIYTQGNDYAPTLGRVTAVFPQIGCVDVETYAGNLRFNANELIKRNDIDTSFMFDTSEQTWERQQANKVASRYVQESFSTLVKEAFILYTKENVSSEIKTYDTMFKRHASTTSESSIQEAVSFVYKNALYWREMGRKYAPTRSELESGCFSCPKCKCQMQRTNYKKLTKLLACPQCLWLICQEDLAIPNQCCDTENI